MAQRQVAKPLFGALPSDQRRNENDIDASSNLLAPGTLGQSSRPADSQRSLRTVGEAKSNVDGPEKIDEFLLRQRTEKPKLQSRKLELSHQRDGLEAQSAIISAAQTTQPVKILLQSSGAESAGAPHGVKVQSITPQIIRADQVQLLDKKDLQSLHVQQEGKQILSPHSRNQLETYKSGRLVGKHNAFANTKSTPDELSSRNLEGKDSQEGKDPDLSHADEAMARNLHGLKDCVQDPGAASASIRLVGGLDRHGASDQDVGGVEMPLL